MTLLQTYIHRKLRIWRKTGITFILLFVTFFPAVASQPDIATFSEFEKQFESFSRSFYSLYAVNNKFRKYKVFNGLIRSINYHLENDQNVEAVALLHKNKELFKNNIDHKNALIVFPY